MTRNCVREIIVNVYIKKISSPYLVNYISHTLVSLGNFIVRRKKKAKRRSIGLTVGSEATRGEYVYFPFGLGSIIPPLWVR